VAAVRHGESNYDGSLIAGVERFEARDRVRVDVAQVLELWRTSPA